MKKKLIFPSGLILLILLLPSCKKTTFVKYQNKQKVEVYLLKEYEMVEGFCKIDNSTISMKSQAIIFNDDIEYYKLSDHSMGLNSGAIERVKEVGDWGAFCITVNKSIIYSGFFKPGYSSSICAHSVTIDPLSFSGDKIFFKLGYPGSLLEFFNGEDPRANEALIEAFRNQGKLRE